MIDRKDPVFRQQVLVSQIIVFAMSSGVLMFGLIVHFFIGPAEAEEPANPWFARGALLAGLFAVVAHRVLGSAVASGAAKVLPVEESAAQTRLFQAHQTGLIVSLALLEGAAFLCLVFYGFVDGDQTLLGMAILLWLAILVRLPFAWQVAGWIDQRMRTHRELTALRADSN